MIIDNAHKLQGCRKDMLNALNELDRSYPHNVHIHINSGYRSPEYNEQVGGSKTSSHIKGLAVDVHVEDVHPLKVAAQIMNNVKGFCGIGVDVYADYVHFDMDRKKGRRYWVYGKDGMVS